VRPVIKEKEVGDKIKDKVKKVFVENFLLKIGGSK
jgi:hypothetical protein